nr:hypothetical protein [Clostridium paraputrificum]
MIYSRETDIEKVTSEILDILEKNKVSIGLLDNVLSSVRECAHFNTTIQNPKEN